MDVAEWTNRLRVGDSVIVVGEGDFREGNLWSEFRRHKISGITPNQIKLDNGTRFWKKNGLVVGADVRFLRLVQETSSITVTIDFFALKRMTYSECKKILPILEGLKSDFDRRVLIKILHGLRETLSLLKMNAQSDPGGLE